MITSEDITIKVPKDVAEAYRSATREEKEQIQLKIVAIMQLKMGKGRTEAVKKLRQTMDSASQEAQNRGLTPEILESILNEPE